QQEIRSSYREFFDWIKPGENCRRDHARRLGGFQIVHHVADKHGLLRYKLVYTQYVEDLRGFVDHLKINFVKEPADPKPLRKHFKVPRVHRAEQKHPASTRPAEMKEAFRVRQ